MSHELPTVEEYLIQKQKRRELKPVPLSRYKNLILVSEDGADPKIDNEQLRDLAKATRKAVKLLVQNRKLSKERTTSYNKIKDTAKEHPVFGGVNMPDSKSKVRVRISDNIEWDGPALKDRLGDSATAVVSEMLEMKFAVPLGHVMPNGEVLTTEKAKTILHLGFLARLGLSMENQDDKVENNDDQNTAVTANFNTSYTVNEALLAEMVQNKTINSLEGTGVVSREFKVEVDAK